jgi:hypothetical protein
MPRKILFIVMLVGVILGSVAGAVVATFTAEVPVGVARAMATEKYASGTVVESYTLPGENRFLNTRVFLICGTSDNLLHRVKVSGIATSPVVTEAGIINGVACK